jgi:hypothetical protein
VGDRPTIYLTNATSRRPPHRGPGRVLTIMAAPRPAFGEAGEGRVPLLTPPLAWVQAVKAGTLSFDDYREWYRGGIEEQPSALLEPGNLWTTADSGGEVVDGDTLICACSREAAAAGRCHRVWAAEALARAGWRVVLDGVEVPDAVT